MPSSIIVENSIRPVARPAAVRYCDSFACRLKGLMFRSGLHPDEGLLLVESRDSRLDASIHMFFVPFDLAVFWINSGHIVVDKVLAKSWRPAYLPKAPARFTLELHAARWDDYRVGEEVRFLDA